MEVVNGNWLGNSIGGGIGVVGNCVGGITGTEKVGG
jgi:hypothetical protein